MSRIDVDIGDIVHQGQTLAVLEVPELKAELQQTVFQLQQTKEEIARAQHEINRAEAEHARCTQRRSGLSSSSGPTGFDCATGTGRCRGKDLSSEAQVDAAKSAMAAAQEHTGAAQSDNQRVEALHNYTNVRAPLDGVVIWRYADTGH